MTRPQPGDIAPNESLNVNADTLTRGNPKLAPYFADNMRSRSRVVLRRRGSRCGRGEYLGEEARGLHLDRQRDRPVRLTGHRHQLAAAAAQASLLSRAQANGSNDPHDRAGHGQPASKHDEVIDLYGFELTYTQPLDFLLKGAGFTFNYTNISQYSTGGLPGAPSSAVTWAFAVHVQPHGLLRESRVLGPPVVRGARQLHRLPRQQRSEHRRRQLRAEERYLDGSFSYKLPTEMDFSISLELQNITNEQQLTYFRSNAYMPRTAFAPGRQILLGHQRFVLIGWRQSRINEGRGDKSPPFCPPGFSVTGERCTNELQRMTRAPLPFITASTSFTLHHGGVARRGHGQRAMRRAVLHRRLRTLAFQEAVGEAGGEAVAAADAVVDLQVLAHHRLVELAARVEDRRPVVEVAVFALRSVVAATLKFGNCFTAVWIIFLKLAGSMAEMCSSRPSTSKPRQAVKSSSLPIITSTYLAMLRLIFCAPSLPPWLFQSDGAVVEVVGDDRAVLARDLDGLDHRFGGVGRERGEDAAGVEPAHAFLAEQLLPVHLARLDLRGRGVAAVRAAQRGADAEALLGEVQADARVAARGRRTRAR